MCILLVYVNRCSDSSPYKLIIATNRDEYFNRPAKAATFWADRNVLAGRDMTAGKEGGTWFGVSRNGRIAALLNDARKSSQESNRSRGPLVPDFLLSPDPLNHLNTLLKASEEYNPFQLVTFDLMDQEVMMRHFSNIDRKVVDYTEDGVYGFSNGALDKPYQKASRGRDLLLDVVQQHGQTIASKDILVSKLLELLRNTEDNMPDVNLEKLSGLPKNLIPALSAINVKLSAERGFGTRTNTVVLVDSNENIDFYEWSHDGDPSLPNHFSVPTVHLE